jgi:cation:H+ antiporter
MAITIALFIVGFVLLIKGADLFVDAASSIAKRYNISNFVIGLTVVAFGSSLPELLISLMASIDKAGDIALGNIIGSNISNTLLILGAVAITTPLLIKRDTINKEIPFSLLAVVALGILANDALIEGGSHSILSRIDGLILLLFFGIFIYYSFNKTKKKGTVLEKVGKDKIEVYNKWISAAMIGGGIVALFLGGRWVVGGASEIAFYFGLSEAFVGLTIAAIGTFLPELATSLVGAKKGHADMAVGNVVGSNIFNFLWVIGLSASISKIDYSFTLNLDIVFLLCASIILMFLIYSGRRHILDRREGAFLLILYFIYLFFVVLRG